MSASTQDGPPPPTFIYFGPDANCTLDLCPIEASTYQYRPSVPANAAFIALYGLASLAHAYLGWRWKSWWFAAPCMVGCAGEIGGYVGRLILYDNPWSFEGFMVQIVLITTAPVFFTASIYVTLSRTINFLNPAISRIRPSLFYWIFIPADVLCLILQGAGGALSTISSGSSSTGVDIAMAGLALQVAVLFFFSIFYVDYIIRYLRDPASRALTTRVRLYLGFLFSAIVLILVRCMYRCYELSKGYRDSDLITDEGLFIGLEGVVVVLAVFALCIGNPGLLLHETGVRTDAEKVVSSDNSETEIANPIREQRFFS